MTQMQVHNQWQQRLGQFLGIIGFTALIAVASGANVNINNKQPSSALPEVSQVCNEKDGEKICSHKELHQEKPKKFTYVHK
jgi:hypothetical protein